MAKLDVLYLPKPDGVDEYPFALVLSDCGAEDFDALAPGLTTFKENCGARAVLVVDFPVEVE